MVSPSGGPRLLVNADDFGASHAVNRGVCSALLRGLVSTVSLEVNGPEISPACEFLRAHRLTGTAGLHFNIAEGVPLSEEMRGCQRLVDGDGNFRGRCRLLHLEGADRLAVAAELRAQHARCLKEGIHPEFIDSHQHMHTEPAVARVVLGLLPELEVFRVRLARNLGPAGSPLRHLYRESFNRRLRRRGVNRTAYFGGIDDVERTPPERLVGQHVECEVHPVEFDDAITRDGYSTSAPELQVQVARLPCSPIQLH